MAYTAWVAALLEAAMMDVLRCVWSSGRGYSTTRQMSHGRVGRCGTVF